MLSSKHRLNCVHGRENGTRKFTKVEKNGNCIVNIHEMYYTYGVDVKDWRNVYVKGIRTILLVK